MEQRLHPNWTTFYLFLCAAASTLAAADSTLDKVSLSSMFVDYSLINSMISSIYGLHILLKRFSVLFHIQVKTFSSTQNRLFHLHGKP